MTVSTAPSPLTYNGDGSTTIKGRLKFNAYADSRVVRD